jgi:phage N-6-adenine-methyltransferase
VTLVALPLFPDEAAPTTRWTALFSAKSDEWPTDDAVVDELARRYGPFTLDVAATAENAKAPRFFTEFDDGLSKSWADEVGGGAVWCNPPYSDVEAWVAKALAESLRGATVVLLLPSRTDTRWFHLLLAAQDRCEILFCRGRLRFGDATSSAPFPSLVIVCRGRR